MNSLIIFAVFVMAAYIFQMFLGWQQLKDFNKTYTMLRKLGRVLKASKMQGVTILARFQNMDDYVGEDIHYFDKYNPLVRKENKLMQSAIEDARKVYLLHEAGIEKETSSSDSFLGFGFYANYLQLSIKQLLKKNKKRGSL